MLQGTSDLLCGKKMYRLSRVKQLFIILLLILCASCLGSEYFVLLNKLEEKGAFICIGFIQYSSFICNIDTVA